MKALFIFYNPSGGMETLNRFRGKALASHGVETHLLYQFDGQGRNNIKNIKTFVTSNLETIRDIINREHYDVITVCTDINMFETLRSLGYNGHLIYELQGLGPGEEEMIIQPIFRDIINHHVDAILYPQNDRLRALMTSNYGHILQYCFDNPLDWDNFGYTAYPQKPFPIMGWVGRIQSNKNWRDFLQLGLSLMHYYPELKLWLFDDDSMSNAFELQSYNDYLSAFPNLASHLIRYSNVPHEQMADYYSIIGDSGGFLLSSSVHEGFGYAVAEAMLCRCPVLSTDSGGVLRFIEHNITGKLYDRGNIEQATVEAISLMTDLQLREKLIVNAEPHIKSNFSSDLYAKRFITMMNQIDHVLPKH